MNRRRVKELEAAVSLTSTKVLGGWGGGLAPQSYPRLESSLHEVVRLHQFDAPQPYHQDAA
jgi:hypothetical protein